MSDDARNRMVDDFGRKLNRQLEAMLQREVDLAKHVFDGPEITSMMMKVAVSVNLMAIGVALQTKRDDVEPAVMFDIMAAGIAELTKSRKDGLDGIMRLIEATRRAGGR